MIDPTPAPAGSTAIETLTQIIAANRMHTNESMGRERAIATAILAHLTRDEAIERAAKAGYDHVKMNHPNGYGTYDTWGAQDESYREYLRGIQRAAVLAALGEVE